MDIIEWLGIVGIVAAVIQLLGYWQKLVLFLWHSQRVDQSFPCSNVLRRDELQDRSSRLCQSIHWNVIVGVGRSPVTSSLVSSTPKIRRLLLCIVIKIHRTGKAIIPRLPPQFKLQNLQMLVGKMLRL
jgi:hypothetical protein